MAFALAKELIELIIANNLDLLTLNRIVTFESKSISTINFIFTFS